MNTFTPPQARLAWQRLQALAGQGVPHLREQRSTPALTEIEAAGLTLDSRRQRLTPAAWQLLLELARESRVAEQARAMFAGEPINATERRAVLHVALRGADWADAPWGTDISAQVRTERERFLTFAEEVRAGLRGFTGGPITDIVNVGIGGSDLGPRMACEALGHLSGTRLRVHFASNPDAWSLHSVLRHLQPANTLFIVQSKTFTTQETLALAESAHRWLADGGCPADQLHLHLAAVTANPELARAQGHTDERIFGFWDWVGGRYSVWSAIGLPLAISVGAPAFREFLAGAHAMDRHFLTAPPEQNLPLRLALTGIWNRNFLGARNLLIANYSARLREFTRFIQQMDMESNGKRIHVDGSDALIGTGPVIWGGLGMDGQHAYFQLLHQGMHTVPVEFIGLRRENLPFPYADAHHAVTNSNLLAQATALAYGRDRDETLQEMLAEGVDRAEAQRLAPHRAHPGNVPSHILWMDTLTPHTLGALVAAYEHKVFCQAAIWGIHAYDQWGVELGKKLAKAIQKGQAG